MIYSNKTCVIIVRVSFKGQEKLVGFVVDSFFNVYQAQTDKIENLPPIEDNEFINSVITEKDKMILLLNIEKIINTKKIILFLNQAWNNGYQHVNTDIDRRNKNGV